MSTTKQVSKIKKKIIPMSLLNPKYWQTIDDVFFVQFVHETVSISFITEREKRDLELHK